MREQLVHIGNGAHALATQILGNPDDAADAVHDAFAKALSRPGAYDERKGPLAPWFLRLLRNHCIDLLRRRRPGSELIDTLPDAAPGPEAVLEIAQRDAQLQAALQGLEPEQRQIVVLRDYLDLGYAEIAQVLDIPPGTVMSRLHRARLRLKEVLNRHEEGNAV